MIRRCAMSLSRLVRDRRVVEQLEVGAVARQRLEARSGGQLQEQIALLLIERRELLAPTDLASTNSANANCDGVCTVKVMNWCTRCTSARIGCGADAVADLPAGRVEGLAERADHHGARAQLRVAQQALVPAAVEDDVLVDFVADQQDVGAVDERGQLPHVVGRPRRAGRVVRRVDEDRARPRRDRALHLVPVTGNPDSAG